MPQIEFKNGSDEFEPLIKSFLVSLGLNPELKSYYQFKKDSHKNSRLTLFGMQISIPSNLLDQESWKCSVTKKDGITRFQINGNAIAAKIDEEKGCNSILSHNIGNVAALALENLPIADLSILNGFSNSLSAINIKKCVSLSSLSGIESKKGIHTFKLWWSEYLKDVNELKGLKKLTTLMLSRCTALKDINPIGDLSEILNLDLSGCKSIKGIECLHGLNKIQKLGLGYCKSLKTADTIKNFENLEVLDLWGCGELRDISFLRNLKKIKNLNLSWCDGLKDISFISDLPELEYLELKKLEFLENVDFVAGLDKLHTIDISECKEVKDLAQVGELPRLQKIDIRNCVRIASIDVLRGCAELKEISGFFPAAIVEVLIHCALNRSDKSFILEKSFSWLSEAENIEAGDTENLEKLARSLGMAFSLLDENEEIIPKYETFLDSHPELGIAPWKAWFFGTRENAGFELLRKRIERIPSGQMFLSAIGGACATMPDQNAPADEVRWARGWLADLEKERSPNAKELLPVAPEICLAYARLGEMEALARWLERLTDPFDPGALDELQVSLARWRLSSGDLQKARSHISAIHSPSARDPILAELVLAELAADPDTASEDILLVQGTETRGDLAKKLATDPTFTSSESRLHRLLVAAGENPTALAELITLIGASVPSEIVNRLSAQLGLPQAELQQWRISQLETLLKQLQTIAKI